MLVAYSIMPYLQILSFKQQLAMNSNLIPEKDLGNNINSQFGLNKDLQAHLASQNAQFVIDIAREMKFGYTVPTLALHIATIFFHKKSFIHYDRLLILAASFLLASKLKSIDCRLKALCNSFYNIVNYRTNGTEPFNQDKMKKIKQYISIYESEILRTFEFDIDVSTPHDFLRKQCQILYTPQREVNRKIYSTTRILILDSYRTRSCLVFRPIIIFIACFLISSRYEGRKPYDNETVRHNCKEQNPSEEKLYQTWLRLIATREQQQIPAAEVRDCLRMINTVFLS